MSSVLGLIPARGGSKGLPDKNLRELAGRPLLAYTVDAARTSGVIDRLILSTDDERIAEAGRALGVEVPFLRPPELAADDTPMLPVVQHAIEQAERDDEPVGWVAILQPTSPLRRPQDVRAAVELARTGGCDSVVGIVEIPRHLSPDYVMCVEQGLLLPFLESGGGLTRRQDARRAYVRDGTIYLARRDIVMESRSLYGKVCLPLAIEAAHSLSIDTPEDWAEAERRLGVV